MTLPAEPKRVKLSLLENAIDSLNEALASVQRAEREPRQWKFAILHLVHALELSIKERLHREHRLLLWENVDRPGRTVSLEQALKRLMAVDVVLDNDDVVAIRTAIKWRNNITHFETDMILAEAENTFILLLEFLNSFHHAHFGSDLTSQLNGEVTAIATDLIARFRCEFIEFRGREMHRSWPAALQASQAVGSLTLGEESFSRIPWGSETPLPASDRPTDMSADTWDSVRFIIGQYCHDCSTSIGDLHGPGCDMEECPRCRGQLLGCDCDWDDSPLWGMDEPPVGAAG